MWTKAGTQHIDGYWKRLRAQLRNTAKPTPEVLEKLVRAAQWNEWTFGKDRIAEAAKLVI